MQAEELARFFHETYERLAPQHGYETREETAVPWDQVPAENRGLMIAVAEEVLGRFGVDIALEIRRLTGAIMEAASEPERVENVQRFETWAYLELFGHRVVVGYIQEDEIAGKRVLGVKALKRAKRDRGVGEPDPPLELSEKWICYSPAAIFSFEHLADEAEARAKWQSVFASGGRLYVDPSDDDIPF